MKVKVGQILWIQFRGWKRAKVEKVYKDGFDWGSYGKGWGSLLGAGGSEPYVWNDGKRYWRKRKPICKP